LGFTDMRMIIPGKREVFCGTWVMCHQLPPHVKLHELIIEGQCFFQSEIRLVLPGERNWSVLAIKTNIHWMHTPYLVSIFICPIVPYYSNWTQDSLDILFEMYILRSHPKPTDKKYSVYPVPANVLHCIPLTMKIIHDSVTWHHYHQYLSV
jgi:hypothetical protein